MGPVTTVPRATIIDGEAIPGEVSHPYVKVGLRDGGRFGRAWENLECPTALGWGPKAGLGSSESLRNRKKPRETNFRKKLPKGVSYTGLETGMTGPVARLTCHPGWAECGYLPAALV